MLEPILLECHCRVVLCVTAKTIAILTIKVDNASYNSMHHFSMFGWVVFHSFYPLFSHLAEFPNAYTFSSIAAHCLNDPWLNTQFSFYRISDRPYSSGSLCGFCVLGCCRMIGSVRKCYIHNAFGSAFSRKRSQKVVKNEGNKQIVTHEVPYLRILFACTSTDEQFPCEHSTDKVYTDSLEFCSPRCLGEWMLAYHQLQNPIDDPTTV